MITLLNKHPVSLKLVLAGYHIVSCSSVKEFDTTASEEYTTVKGGTNGHGKV